MKKETLETKEEIAHFLTILEACTRLLTEEMDGEDRAKIIKVCLNLTSDQVKDRAKAIAEAATSLFLEKLGGWDRAQVTKVYLQFTPEQIKAISENVPALLDAEIDGNWGPSILKAYLDLSPEQIKAIAEAAPVLFNEQRIENDERIWVIEACSGLSPEQIKDRVQAIEEASSALFTEAMGAWERAQIIRECLNLTPEKIAQKAVSMADR